MEKQISKAFTIAKDIPALLSAKHDNSDAGFWLYASREIVDSTGDIVRIDGIDLSKYHNPPESHLKILAQHLKVLPDGTAPVVAIVKDYVRTYVPYKGDQVKALALWCEWLRHADTGELLPLAKHYKELVDAGGIDSGSVGLIVNTHKQIDGGGLDITKSFLFETSLVTIPANGSATVVRQKLAEMGYELDEPTAEPVTIRVPKMTAEEADRFMAKWYELSVKMFDGDRAVVMKDEPDPNGGARVLEGLQSLTDAVKALTDRIDATESALVVLANTRKSPGEGNHKGVETTDTAELELVRTKLEELQKFLGR